MSSTPTLVISFNIAGSMRSSEMEEKTSFEDHVRQINKPEKKQ